MLFSSALRELSCGYGEAQKFKIYFKNNIEDQFIFYET